jgi:glycosyltransferase involved in cell wall biosynthesis
MNAPRPLRIGVDATPLVSGNTGVAQYTKQLLRCLQQHEGMQVVPFAIGRGPDPGIPLRRVRVPLRVVHRSWRILHQPTVERFSGRVDVVHAVDMIPPPTKGPMVMTIHDVLPIEIPEMYGRRWVRTARAAVREAWRARVVFATCTASAERIADLGVAPLERIVVASPGRRPPLGVTEPLVPPPYILAVGSVTPRKAFDVLADALAELGDDAPRAVIAGPDGWRADVIRKRVAALGLEHRMSFLGRVDDISLERLYRNAAVVCHPSIAEGFGIPCLEALGYGIPVVAADIPPVRELGDGCMELVPAADPRALAEGLRRVLSDGALVQARVAAGRARAAAYTWEAMSDRIVEAYRLAAS